MSFLNTSVIANENTTALIEDSLSVNNIKYRNVLHLQNEDTEYKDIWIAANVGIVKKINRDDRIILLVNHHIVK